MNQILHILKKDLCRYAWAWITLLCFAGIEVYLHGTTQGLLDSGLNRGLSMLTSMIGGILFFVVIVMVVQEETLCDPDAYWISRPIARGKLLLSKLLFLLILIAAYQISDSIVLILNGGASRIAFPLLEMITALAIWQSQVFLAAQTRSLPRYLLLIVSIFVGFYALMFGLFFFIETIFDFSFDLELGQLPANTPSHILALIQTTYWFLVGLGILSLMYCRRRILLSWALLLPALLIAGILTPGNSIMGISTDDYFDAEDKGLILDHLRKGATMHTNGEEFIEVRAIFSVSGEAADKDIWATVSSADIRMDGQTIHLDTNRRSQKLQEIHRKQRSLSLGYAKLNDLKGNEANLGVDFSYELKFSNQIQVGNMPLREASSYFGEGNRLVIRSIYRDENTLNVKLAATIPSYSFEPNHASSSSEAFEGKYSFALADQNGNFLQDFSLSMDWNIMSRSTAGSIEAFLNEDFSLDDYNILVFAREIQSSTYDYITSSDISFKK